MAASASPAAPGTSAAGRGGYANPDEAIAGHLSAVPGVRYLGLCKNAKRDPVAICALRMGFVDQDEVYGLGAPHSEIVGFLLLREESAGWRVADDIRARRCEGQTAGVDGRDQVTRRAG